MPVTPSRWTDEGREDVGPPPERSEAVARRVEAAGAELLGDHVTVGRCDRASVVEAPDDETIAKLALMVAGRGNAVSETLRGFSPDEVRRLL